MRCAELHAYYHKVDKEKVIPFMVDKNSEELNCDHYKDKSLCVELPCKVGDKLYWLSLHRDMVEAHLKETGFVAKLENGFEYIIPFDVIGKTVFLTKEDAEKELKKRYAENK
jgi:hypothetical protein